MPSIEGNDDNVPSRGYGVLGYSNNGDGVVGYSAGSGYGVGGVSDSGTGMYAMTWRGAALVSFSSSSNSYAAVLNGKVKITGNLEKAGGSFKIDHPLDPANKYLSHSFVESPDMKNVYDGVEY